MATQQAAETKGAQDPEHHQVLTFELGNEMYGIEILRVREIRGWTSVTKIPHAPSHVLGVLNLRGSIVPVVDLRMRFELERAEYTKDGELLILMAGGPDQFIVLFGHDQPTTANPPVQADQNNGKSSAPPRRDVKAQPRKKLAAN